MLGILEKTEEDHARPTKAVKERMIKVWGRETAPQQQHYQPYPMVLDRHM